MRSVIFWTGVTDSYVILRYQWNLMTWQLNQAIDWFECGVTLLDSVVRLSITQHTSITLQWRHNGRDSVSDRQLHDCLLNRLFRRRSKKTPKLTGLCAGNSPGTGEFPAQMSSNAENVSIWWHHHDISQELHTWFCGFDKPKSHCKQIIKYQNWTDISLRHGLLCWWKRSSYLTYLQPRLQLQP